MIHPKLLIIEQLENLYRHFNDGLFDGKLQVPSHVLRHDKKVVFRFLPESLTWVIGSQFAALHDPKDLACHYLHEMVHVSNFIAGVEDCTSNQYHNKNYLSAALGVGFHVYRHKTQGWAITKFNPGRIAAEHCAPEPQAVERREKLLSHLPVDMDVVRAAQEQFREHLKDNRPKPCFLKYVCQCPPPHNSVRSGRRPDGNNPPRIKCEVCGAAFQFSEN